MADNIVLNAGSGGSTLAADDIAGVWYPIQKTAFGALDSATLAASGAGAVAAGVQRVTLASDDPAVVALQILDNAIAGTEMQVDVVAALPAGTNNIGDVDVLTFPAEVHSADFDSGAGTDNTLSFGIAVAAAGGAAVVTGDVTNGLDVDVTRVSGTVTVDGSGVTQPVSNAGLTELAAAINVSSQMDVNLAANGIGLATSAKQDTIITAVQLLDDTVQVLGTDVYTEATSKGITLGAVRRDADTTLVSLTNEFGPLQMDANGRLKVEAFSGETLPVSGTVTANLAAGTNNIGDVDVLTLPALPAGNNNIGDVDVASIAAGTNAIGNVGVITRTTGGATPYTNTDIQEVANQIKGAAGTLYTLYAWNMTAAPLWLKVYDQVGASVTPGTTAPTIDLMVPANADSDGAGFVVPLPAMGLAFGTGITLSGSTTRGTTAVDVGAAGNLGVFAVYA